MKHTNRRPPNYKKNVRRVVSSSGYVVRQRQARLKQYNNRTFHCHMNSSSFGGTTLFFGCSGPGAVSSAISASSSSASGCFGASTVASSLSSSNASNSSGLATSPKFLTAGRPFLSERSFKVNRGPISCS